MRNCIWEPDQDCINKMNEHDIPNAIPPKGHHQADWKDNLSLLYPFSQVLWWVSLVILCCVRRLGSGHMRCMAPVGLNNGLDSNDLWLFTLEASLAMYIHMTCMRRRLAFCLYFATEMCLIFNIAYPLNMEHSPWDDDLHPPPKNDIFTDVSSSRQRRHTSKAGVIVRERWRCFGRWKWIGDVMMELDQVLECYEFGCVLWSKSTPEVYIIMS